jgi:hypothetical protein
VTVASCPTDVVNAPIEIVWELLNDPLGWGAFYDLRIIRVEPPGLATMGQRIFAESGPRWLHLGVTILYTAIDEPRRSLELEVRMPLGITAKEELECSVINDRQCRVNYHCHFTLPAGWRGALLRMFLWRELRVGPADSLRRIKRAAERRFGTVR